MRKYCFSNQIGLNWIKTPIEYKLSIPVPTDQHNIVINIWKWSLSTKPAFQSHLEKKNTVFVLFPSNLFYENFVYTREIKSLLWPIMRSIFCLICSLFSYGSTAHTIMLHIDVPNWVSYLSRIKTHHFLCSVVHTFPLFRTQVLTILIDFRGLSELPFFFFGLLNIYLK